MAGSQELQMLSALAIDENDVTIFAVQPKEWSRAPWDHRTFVLKLNASEASIVEVVPRPIHDCWLSGNGTAYCPTKDGVLLTRTRGQWGGTLRVCDRNEEFKAIFGFTGAAAKSDDVLIAGMTVLISGHANSWSEHRAPDEVSRIYRMHGLDPAEVYVCSDAGMFLWDGSQFEAVDGPDDEIRDVLVLSEKEMLATGERVHRWTEALGWTELESPVESHARGSCLWGDLVFVPSLKGVLRVNGDILQKVANFSCNLLVPAGRSLLAAGASGGAARYNGKTWTRIELPRLAPFENA